MPQIATNKKEILFDKISKSTYFKKKYSDQTIIKSMNTLEPFYVRKIPLWKRMMDIVGAIFGLILFSPFFLIISILIKIVSHGPVFFKQDRVHLKT